MIGSRFSVQCSCLLLGVYVILHHGFYSLLLYGKELTIGSLDPFYGLREGEKMFSRIYMGDPKSVWGHFYTNMGQDVSSLVLSSLDMSLMISASLGFLFALVTLVQVFGRKNWLSEFVGKMRNSESEDAGGLEGLQRRIFGAPSCSFYSVRERVKLANRHYYDLGDLDSIAELKSPMSCGNADLSTTEADELSSSDSDTRQAEDCSDSEAKDAEAKDAEAKDAASGGLASLGAALLERKVKSGSETGVECRESLCCSLAGTLVSILITMSVFANVTSFVYGGLSFKSIGFPDLFLARVLYSKAISYDMTLFSSGAFDLLGLLLMIWTVFRLKSRVAPVVSISSLLCLLLLAQELLNRPKCNGNDKHWLSTDADGLYESLDSSAALPAWVLSDYVSGFEGLDIAVDTYLPYYMYNSAGRLDGGRKLPVHIVFTRYHRRMQVNWPFSLLSIFGQKRGSTANVWSWEYVDSLLPHDIAVMVVDVRGTGASGGFRKIDLSDEELADFPYIIAHAKRQEWSNGQVSVGGISYDGMTGLQVAARSRVDAVVALYSPINIFDELFVPGGLMCRSFLLDYISLTRVFEQSARIWSYFVENRHRYPVHMIIGFAIGFTSTAGVPHKLARFRGNVQEHFKNWKMREIVDQIEFLDDAVTTPDGTLVDWHRIVQQEAALAQIAHAQTPVYFVGGFCDAGIARGITRAHRSLLQHSPRSQLTLGPWTHGGRRSCSPYTGSFSCFEKDMYVDIAHFLKKALNYWPELPEKPREPCFSDSHLDAIASKYRKTFGKRQAELIKQLENAPVRYWVAGAEEWRVASQWPPAERRESSYSFWLQKYQAQKQAAQRENGPAPSLKRAANSLARAVRRICQSVAAPGSLKAAVIRLVNDYPQLLSDYQARAISPRSRMQVDRVMSATANTYYLLDQNHSWHGVDAAKHVWCFPHVSPASIPDVLALIAKIQRCTPLQGADGWLLRRSRVAEPAHFVQLFRRDSVAYTVDYQATTGLATRWPVAQHPFRLPVNYGNRLFSPRHTSSMHGEEKKRTRPSQKIAQIKNHPVKSRLFHFLNVLNFGISTVDFMAERAGLASPLAFVSPPLQKPLTIVGAPFLQLLLKVEHCTDLVVFAYLEDVDREANTVHYITEGKVMASHRPNRVDTLSVVGLSDAVSRQYVSTDYAPIFGSETVVAPFTLEPTAWTLRPGHSLRLSLVGSDVDNFMLRYHRHKMELPTDWKFMAADGSDRNAIIATLKLPVA